VEIRSPQTESSLPKAPPGFHTLRRESALGKAPARLVGESADATISNLRSSRERRQDAAARHAQSSDADAKRSEFHRQCSRSTPLVIFSRDHRS